MSTTLPTFRLRSWAEQTLYDARDYLVVAESLEAAIEKLAAAEQAVAEDGGTPRRFGGIAGIDRWMSDDVVPLDPGEIVGGEHDICQIDEAGDPIRPPPARRRDMAAAIRFALDCLDFACDSDDSSGARDEAVEDARRRLAAVAAKLEGRS
jgi:hypothetical protein